MSYILMHKNIEVLSCELDPDSGVFHKITEVFSRDHLPVGVKDNRKSINIWFKGRAIPSTRDGLYDALNQLRLAYCPTTYLSMCANGVSLADCYWVKPEYSGLVWEDVSFYRRKFSSDIGEALFSRLRKNENIDLCSPDGTTNGWLMKRWIVENGQHFLLKAGSGTAQQEPFNEVLADEIMTRLAIPHVPYELVWEDGKPLSKCPNFLQENEEYIPACCIAEAFKKSSSHSTYQHFLYCCKHLGISGAEQALEDMMVVDYIIANTDRHWGNFGAVRNTDTLEWKGIAPVFDTGTSLFHDTLIIQDPSAQPFEKTHDKQIQLVRDLSRYDFSALSGIEDPLADLLRQAAGIDDQRRQALVTALSRRIQRLQSYSHATADL